MCKKSKCGICLVILTACAMLLWMIYLRISQSKQVSREGAALVNDMKSLYSESRKVCGDAKNLGKAVANETVSMKDEVAKEVNDVKQAICPEGLTSNGKSS